MAHQSVSASSTGGPGGQLHSVAVFAAWSAEQRAKSKWLCLGRLERKLRVPAAWGREGGGSRSALVSPTRVRRPRVKHLCPQFIWEPRVPPGAPDSGFFWGAGAQPRGEGHFLPWSSLLPERHSRASLLELAQLVCSGLRLADRRKERDL